MRRKTRIRWALTRRSLVALALLSVACDRQPPTAGQPAIERDRNILESLEQAGYRGPVLVAEQTPIDDRGAGPTTRMLFLPREGHVRLRAAAERDAKFQRSLGSELGLAAEASEELSPDDVDPFHNVPVTALGRTVNPSRLNGKNPIQSRILFSVAFYSYDDKTESWYQVPGGEVLQTIIEASDSTGKTRVNDIALFYGGRFDIGRKLKGQPYEPCSDANSAACWGYSHFEHRYGTEVDINPERGVTRAHQDAFLRTLKAEFASVKVEGDHFHARVAQSPYVQ